MRARPLALEPNRDRPRAEARVLRRTRLRLMLWSGGTTLMALLVLATATYFSVRESLVAASVAQLRERAVSLDKMASVPPKFRGEMVNTVGAVSVDPGEPGIVIGGPTSGTVGLVILPDGQFFAGGVELAIPGPNIDSPAVVAAYGGETTVRETTLKGAPARVLTLPFQVAGETYVIQVFADRIAEVRTLEALLLVLGIGSAAVVAVALAIGWLYAGRALVPIRASLQRQREFAADASHELRTPLAVVATSVESLRRLGPGAPDTPAVMDDIDASLGHLTSLVDDLLLLARADSCTMEIEQREADLADAVTEALDGLAPLATSCGIGLGLDAEPSPVTGDARRLRQLVTILADNAVRHSPTGGTVSVAVRQVDGGAELSVSDEGPGIRPEDLAHVFDRFWRARDAPHGGNGLGLAIAAWIVECHGGQIRAENGHGGGARFSVRVPLLRAGAA